MKSEALKKINILYQNKRVVVVVVVKIQYVTGDFISSKKR